MSGGSYNYLCMDTTEDLFLPDRIETLERMVGRLQELNAGPAADEAQTMLSAIKSVKGIVSDSHARLSELFKAVEWLDSNDCDEEGVQKALECYKENNHNHIPITSAFRTVEENNRIATQSSQLSPSLHFPSLAMPRQQTYRQTAKPVRPTIISRSDSDMVVQDWYFSCDDSSIFLSGYRRYERDVAGNWFIAARWYPEVHALENLIPTEEVPFPEDVVEEAVKKGYGRAIPAGFKVFKTGLGVVVMMGIGGVKK